jgi:hypothetical protein
MSITIASMIDSPHRRAAHQPPTTSSQTPPGSLLVGITSLAPGSHLVGQDSELKVGTLAGILRQADVAPEEFIAALKQ